MPRVTIKKIVGRTPCPVHRAAVEEECPGGGACEARISADQSSTHVGRPRGSRSGRGLDAQIAVRVTPTTKAGYDALADEARAELQERMRRMIERATEKRRRGG